MTRLPLGVVVPTLNAGRTLCRTLFALQPLMAGGAEVIIVDGGSTDDTLPIADRFGVRTISVAGNMYAALNAGMTSVQADWLTWINADDVLFADTVEPRIVRARAAAVAYGPVDFVDASDRFIHSWLSARPTDLLDLYRAGYSPLLQQGTLFRRAVFEALGGFRSSYSFVADADFWWRALERGFSFARANYPTVAAFRLHSSQLSHRHKQEMAAEHARMVEAHGGSGWSMRACAAALRFRGANLSRYVGRVLRSRDLEGRWRCSRSYDLPNTQPLPNMQSGK